MAPRGRRDGAAEPEPQAFHELGVRGRKTGVFLPDAGERDEHGMQPLGSIFSSPRKPSASNAAEDSGSEDMELASSAGPGPRILLQKQRNVQHPIPRSHSPIQTHLKSPARKLPLGDRLSSPLQRSGRSDRDVTVTRRLDFTARAGNTSSAAGATSKTNGVNGTRRSPRSRHDEGLFMNGDEDVPDMDIMVETSLQMVEAMDEDDEEDDLEDRVRGGRRRSDSVRRGSAASAERSAEKRRSFVEEDEDEEEEASPEPQLRQPVKRGRGKPSRAAQAEERKRQAASPRSTKRRPSNASLDGNEVASDRSLAEDNDDSQDEEPDQTRQPKRQRTRGPAKTTVRAPAATAKAAATAGKAPAAQKAQPKPVPVAKGKQRWPPNATRQDDDDAGEASMALRKCPPLPKSRGLVSVRGTMTQTRSGRHSYKPVDYWRGEQVIRQDEQHADAFYKDDFVLPSIKEVIRVPQDAPPPPPARKRRGGNTTKKHAPRRRRRSLSTSDSGSESDAPEAWELHPGTVTGEVIQWEPEHEAHPPADDDSVHVSDERIALSAEAIQTSDIKDASFRFAKILTTPFMGAGVVDLPPGAEKRPKNSRRMHMVFFVHRGKALVTVNDAQFRISAGGMWFVPPGNYYSITNDYDRPCRVFFAQGNEWQAQRRRRETPALAY